MFENAVSGESTMQATHGEGVISLNIRYEARFFGTPELLLDGERVSFPFLKAKVLALLLVEERSLARDKLCALLWGNKPLHSGRRNLSTALTFDFSETAPEGRKHVIVVGDETPLSRSSVEPILRGSGQGALEQGE